MTSDALRIRSYQLYREAMRLSAGIGLATGAGGISRAAASEARLARFDEQRKRLQRQYADVFGARGAPANVYLAKIALRNARKELRGKVVASSVKRYG